MLSYEHIEKCSSGVGFSLCGVARARVLSEHEPWFAAGLEASGPEGLRYLRRRPERRFDPSALLPGARTVIVCALAYDGSAARDGVAAFARQEEDYHLRILRMLSTISAQIEDASPGTRTRACCDTSAILEKAWAVEAGLGWQGRNSLLITPKHGSFVSLGVLLVDAECDCYDEPFVGVGCGECRACIAACPVGAIGETEGGVRTLDNARCISARTVELCRLQPDASREPLHGWIYGCDDCQRGCPKNNRQNIL